MVKSIERVLAKILEKQTYESVAQKPSLAVLKNVLLENKLCMTFQKSRDRGRILLQESKNNPSRLEKIQRYASAFGFTVDLGSKQSKGDLVQYKLVRNKENN